MRAMLSIPAMLLALVIVHYLHSIWYGASDGRPAPKQQLDLLAVRTDLLAIAQAERLYLATHGRYGTLDQLVQEQGFSTAGAGRHGYTYEVHADGALRFRVTARRTASAGEGGPILSIDETMQIHEFRRASQHSPYP